MLHDFAMKAITIIVQLLAHPLKSFNEMINVMHDRPDIRETNEE